MLKLLLTALMLISGVAFAPAHAQSRTYVSRTGSDGNDCFGLATPCATFGRAISQATAKGEVACLDNGFFGAINITFSIHIDCEHQTGQTGFNYNSINVGPNDVVSLNGIDIDMRGFAGANAGLAVSGAGTVHLRNVRIRNSGGGLLFAPTGGATLFVADSVVESNSGAGVKIAPTGGGYTNAHLKNVRLEHNAIGLAADGSSSTIGVNVNIVGSTVTGNTVQGVAATAAAGQAPVAVTIRDAQITGNLGAGLLASGAAAAIRVGASQIVANATGVNATAGGQVATFGGNQIAGNSVNGAFSSSIPLQ